MSGDARPIPASQFALAIEDLPMENLYSKAVEIQNSIAHLQKSNTQLQEYSDSIVNDLTLDETTRSEGDRDCLEAIKENEVVIQRQQDRIDLLKAEVERRGGRWHGDDATTNPVANGTSETQANGTVSDEPPQRPRLTDEELRRRLEEQMAADDDQEAAGMHL